MVGCWIYGIRVFRIEAEGVTLLTLDSETQLGHHCRLERPFFDVTASY